MNRKSNKKISKPLVIFISIILATVLFIIHLSGIWRGNSFQAWQEQFDMLEPPTGAVELCTQFSDSDVVTGSDDSRYYGYCILLKSDLSKDVLLEYYEPFTENINENVIGNPNELYVVKLDADENTREYHFNDLEQYIENDVTDQNELYIVYIIKPGRVTFIN